jgi:Sec-independent protein translocase protein TatA
MKNISFKQILLLVLIFFFLFGDFFSLKKKIKNFMKYLNTFFTNKSRKKGT